MKNGKNKKHVGGRPPIWTDPEILQELINTYLNNTAMPTLAGLANTLGVSRSTLYNYENKDVFLDTIKKARRFIEQKYEELLIYSNTANTTGVIFALKNTGWKDRTDLTTDDEKIEGLVIVKDGSQTK